MATYQHQSLNGSRNTRLVWLAPSADVPSPLHCRLSEVSLDEPPQYEALSYSWDSQNRDGTILCSNLALKITTNCEAALRHLRHPSQPRVLWVDSICIDQSSIPEKNQQISVMMDIYAKAQRVLVWLGEATDSSDLAMRNLLDFGRLNRDFQAPPTAVQQQAFVFVLGVLACIKPCLGYFTRRCMFR
jgi:hypothetical protein